MKTTPDLPIELWLEILLYLPRSTLHKMIGVNRTLFELALNDLYEEVRFISDDKVMMKSFKQLRHAGIAKRVRQLFVRPAFLPGLDEIDFRSKFERKVASSMTYLKNIARSPLSDESKESLQDSSFAILDVAKNAVKCCPNLREITITLHDHALTPTFISFLESLWTSDSIGPNIRKISIDTTVVKIPILLKPLKKHSTVLTKLEEFDLNISISRYPHTPTEWLSAIQALVSFFTVFKRTLTSVSLSSMIIADLGDIFEPLPRLPKLKKFEFLAVISSLSLPKPEDFTRFISRHASTLEVFIVKPRARCITFNHSDDTYTTWLNHVAPRTSEKRYSFSELELPKLRTLDVGLRDINLYWADPDLSTRALLPDLSQVASNLTKLIMSDVRLSPHRLSAILDTLARHDGGTILEELSFVCHELSSQFFDLLSQKLRALNALTIEYDTTSGTVANYLQFYQEMQARTYPAWDLRYLRLARPHSCGQAHPNTPDMNAVARSLTQNVVLDTEFVCQCFL
ncbi:hypothetical protein GALMADRAFT_228529 [Galerina marginata CBS 339.88]|uniref:F-box domain-containing protein n=1 Tax=Galerina marginata (strain CBS 339.88) TaxID=685588 RepID=A0A067SPK6_GALM3|nr:hypothetical protein GALMADRAFT_228529 [Galerina marginata CBS 339.88]